MENKKRRVLLLDYCCLVWIFFGSILARTREWARLEQVSSLWVNAEIQQVDFMNELWYGTLPFVSDTCAWCQTNCVHNTIICAWAPKFSLVPQCTIPIVHTSIHLKPLTGPVPGNFGGSKWNRKKVRAVMLTGPTYFSHNCLKWIIVPCEWIHFGPLRNITELERPPVFKNTVHWTWTLCTGLRNVVTKKSPLSPPYSYFTKHKNNCLLVGKYATMFSHFLKRFSRFVKWKGIPPMGKKSKQNFPLLDCKTVNCTV